MRLSRWRSECVERPADVVWASVWYKTRISIREFGRFCNCCDDLVGVLLFAPRGLSQVCYEGVVCLLRSRH